ncbi:hypothetical protein BDZ97DRAFT_1915257 [Flammula alnicola]|nr:hypothetical protein BDZ97DRAFT_1915257 [Flammula alnicola]
MSTTTRRQSTRLSAKREATRQAHISAPSTATAPAPPPRKKHKSTTIHKNVASAVPHETDYRKVKGRRGKLKSMTEMPLDILVEIFGQLQPIDLLNLSRATKDIRAIIAGDDTLWKKVCSEAYDTNSPFTFIWKAYQNVKANAPPPCPPGMSFLHYTILVYGWDCQFCASVRGVVVHYGARVRMCGKCAPKQLILTHKGNPKRDKTALSLCLSSYITKPHILQSNNYIFKQEYDRHIQRLKACEDDEAKSLYIKKSTKEKDENDNIARRLSRWHEQQKYNKRRDLENTRRKRREAIVAKLREAGYGPELVNTRFRLENLPGVNLPVELTDREAGEHQAEDDPNIPTSQRRFRYLYPLVEKATEEMPTPCIFADFSHIARSEPFCGIIKDITEGADEDMIKMQIESLAPRLGEISSSWRAEADKVLLGLLSEATEPSMLVDNEEVDRKPLELATTFFKCHWCPDPISYPRVLMHSCLRQRRFPDTDDDEGPEEQESIAKEEDGDSDGDDEDEADDEAKEIDNENGDPTEVHGIPKTTAEHVWDKMSSWFGSTWNEGNDQVSIDEESTKFAKVIVQACGEDLLTVTADRMDEIDARVECLRCCAQAEAKKSSRNRLVMTWKMAILHDIEVHFEDPSTENG